jgi:serine/threonine-protein kinase RsbW
MTIYAARFDSLPLIAGQITQAAHDAGLSEKAVYDVEVAVDEACTNIIEHAYGGEESGLIECITLVIPDGLRIYLRDTGCSFNPDAIPAPDLESPPSLRKERGLGLYFMRRLMDEVRFDPCDESGTLLTMTKFKKNN